MLRRLVFLFFLLFFSISIYPQKEDFNNAAESLSKSVSNFLMDKRDPTISIISLKNTTDLSDNAIQKIYQLFVFKIESNKNVKFKDSMMSFVDGKGKFRTDRNRGIKYLMSLTFIRNKSNVGMGISLFSVNHDKMVFTKYFEWKPLQGEINFLNIKENRFNDFGFERIIEIDSNKDLLDMKTMINGQGDLLYHFYYFDHIQIFKKENNVLKKKKVLKFSSDIEFYQTIKREGKLFFFKHRGKSFLIVGSNFSKNSTVFIFTENSWKYHSKINFVPFEVFRSNGKLYFIGGKYKPGKNFFTNKLILKSIDGTIDNSGEEFYKTVEEFYSISFLKEGEKILSMYSVDRNYNFISYGANFEILSKDEDGNGFAFSLLDNTWIIRTAFLKGKDKLRFFKVNEIEENLKYEKAVDGEILFINEGLWNEKKGVWINVKSKKHNYFIYNLQFWSKKDGL